ncbi:MAG: UDP-N-acetylmuramate dehydrogenase [Verrucomicrobia bacterium]|nr:UDP-N-acetylmuramate dehydrogenase [Verrucomicrobiota bacterium]MDE3099361.1 UDP-N-acetylmuramate dehydrogenase [Verrucomicrobiota bacterium]
MTIMESSPEKAALAGDTIAREFAGILSAGTVFRRAEPLAKHTTLRVGGPVDYYIEPADEMDLAKVLDFCRRRGISFFILGRGSNLLVRDLGFRGAAVCLAQPVFAKIAAAGDQLVCGAGARLKAVALEAKRAELGGLEFLEGIPGSVGGALRMNAGAMGAATFDAIDRVRVMDFCGHVAVLTPSEMAVSYRQCGTLKESVALEAVFRGSRADRAEIEARMISFSKKRWASQPSAPSAGCIFKNPASVPAGRLVEELGLKGLRCGGARVSDEHGNFVVNDGGATAADILELIGMVKEKARQARGIELEIEVEIIGE